MKEVMEALRAWDAAGLASAEAVLVGHAAFVAAATGRAAGGEREGRGGGAVSMGCVESDLREHLLGLLRGEGAARMVHYGAAFAAALEVGLSCGGEIDVWIRRHDPESAAWKGLCALAPDARALLLTRLDGRFGAGAAAPGDAPPAAELAEALGELWARGGSRRRSAARGENGSRRRSRRSRGC
jgi:xanthine/CO dehydrogenase XdhC/CoxF family maturation factor